MNENIKIAYIIFCILLISLTFCITIPISKQIKNKKQILNSKQAELNYILEINEKIEKNNSSLKEIIIKKNQIDNLIDYLNSQNKKYEEQLESINNYKIINKELKDKISYYE